jgi:hypothetical protein
MFARRTPSFYDTPMVTVRLLCWNPELAAERARILASRGVYVDASPLKPPGLIGHFRALAPQAVVIDLDRLPSHGREVATALRSSKSTRQIPIVFAGGLPDKVEAIRRELPDAVFTGWDSAPKALKAAIRNAPVNPVTPTPHMQRYSGSPLVKKLGIKPDMRVATLNAPEDFEAKLGDLPDGAEVSPDITRKTGLVIWFVRSRAELDIGIVMGRMPAQCGLWIVHPKRTSRYKVDFTQNDVRHAGLEEGLVDYKVCAVDQDWSGLKFARKRTSPQG